MAPARDLDHAIGGEARRPARLVLEEEPVMLGLFDRHALGRPHLLERLDQRPRVAHVERHAFPFVGKALELARGRVGGARLDREQVNRRRPRRVPGELGRAHCRAAAGGRQQAPAVVGEEDGVDQLRLAARELGDERDRELVFVQPLEELGDAQLRLGVGELVHVQPAAERDDPRRHVGPPGAVILEALDQARGDFRREGGRVHARLL
jgi:hypothetical protein